MTKKFIFFQTLVLSCSMMACSIKLVAPAPHDKKTPSEKRDGSLEVSALYSNLDNGLEDWHDQTVRGNVKISPIGRINGEISNQSHFGDRGLFMGAGYTHIWNDTWYSSFSAGTSAGGFFLPQRRFDVSMSRKGLKKKNLVLTLGLGDFHAKDSHSDRSLLVSGLYYFDVPFLIEAGARLNESNPGKVYANREFAVLTYAQNKKASLALRYERGGEAYQRIGDNTTISNLVSSETALIWRQWLSQNYGFNIMANHYDNSIYTRSGVELGLFHDF